jgi:hypothetical protein
MAGPAMDRTSGHARVGRRPSTSDAAAPVARRGVPAAGPDGARHRRRAGGRARVRPFTGTRCSFTVIACVATMTSSRTASTMTPIRGVAPRVKVWKPPPEKSSARLPSTDSMRRLSLFDLDNDTCRWPVEVGPCFADLAPFVPGVRRRARRSYRRAAR